MLDLSIFENLDQNDKVDQFFAKYRPQAVQVEKLKKVEEALGPLHWCVVAGGKLMVSERLFEEPVLLDELLPDWQYYGYSSEDEYFQAQQEGDDRTPEYWNY
jgi:hypothetical protein